MNEPHGFRNLKQRRPALNRKTAIKPDIKMNRLNQERLHWIGVDTRLSIAGPLGT